MLVNEIKHCCIKLCYQKTLMYFTFVEMKKSRIIKLSKKKFAIKNPFIKL